jgi:hypothetical protein
MGNSGMTAVTMPKWWGKYSGKRKKEGEGKGKRATWEGRLLVWCLL